VKLFFSDFFQLMALKEERHNNMESDAICPQIPIQCLFSALKVKSDIIITKKSQTGLHYFVQEKV